MVNEKRQGTPAINKLYELNDAILDGATTYCHTDVMKKYKFLMLVITGLFLAVVAEAQVGDRVMAVPQPPVVVTTTTVDCPTFSRGFGLGMRGTDVTNIQNILIEQKYLTTQATGYFGPLTRSAMMRFQKDRGISATGYFGTLSMAHANSTCGKRNGGNWGIPATKPAPCMMKPCLEGTACPPCGETTTPPLKPAPCPMVLCEEGKTCLPCGATTTPPITPPMPPVVSCTMEARLCPDGGVMPRDNICGWRPEQCKPIKPLPCDMTMCAAGTACSPCGGTTAPPMKPLPCMMKPCLEGTTCPPCGGTTTPPEKPLPCPMMMCAAPPMGCTYQPIPGQCGCGILSCSGVSGTPTDMPTDPTPHPLEVM